jgi:hypothetical protein
VDLGDSEGASETLAAAHSRCVRSYSNGTSGMSPLQREAVHLRRFSSSAGRTAKGVDPTQAFDSEAEDRSYRGTLAQDCYQSCS